MQHRKYFNPGFDLIFDELEILKKTKFIDKKDKPTISEFNRKKIDITFDKFFFNYPNFDKNILNNINLKIIHGEVLGIIGGSGSGKTTFVDNLLGLLKPTKGQILANDKNIQLNIHQWQKKIGYVSQSIFIMDASIEENIAFGIEPEKIDKKLVYYEENKVSRLITWNKQKDYAFVICPHGGGLDCHRNWEALSLGCIPIVKTSKIDKLYDNLPVLIVSDWNIIDNNLLNNTINDYKKKFENNEFNMEKIKLNYWTNVINSYK